MVAFKPSLPHPFFLNSSPLRRPAACLACQTRSGRSRSGPWSSPRATRGPSRRWTRRSRTCCSIAGPTSSCATGRCRGRGLWSLYTWHRSHKGAALGLKWLGKERYWSCTLACVSVFYREHMRVVRGFNMIGPRYIKVRPHEAAAARACCATGA